MAYLKDYFMQPSCIKYTFLYKNFRLEADIQDAMNSSIIHENYNF